MKNNFSCFIIFLVVFVRRKFFNNCHDERISLYLTIFHCSLKCANPEIGGDNCAELKPDDEEQPYMCIYIYILVNHGRERGISVAITRMNPAEDFCVYFSSDASLGRRKGFVRLFGGGRSFRNSVVRLQSRRCAP